MGWEFASGDPEIVEQWSEAVVRDAEKQLIWAPMMYSLDDDKAIRHPDANKGQGIIKVHTLFQGGAKKGRTVHITNVADITGRGVHGEGLLRDTGANMDTYTMDLTFEDIAHQVRTTGPMSERLSVVEFRSMARKQLARWARRKTEGAIVLALWGLTSWNNTTKLRGWSQTGQETEVFGNTIQAFDSDHIVYAGNGSSNSDLGQDDIMTAQLLTKLETKALEDLDIPLEPMNFNGEDGLVLYLSHRGCEQLQYDDDWKAAQNNNTRSPQHPQLRGTIGKYGRIWVVPYAFALNPAANVGQGVLCGMDALHFCKVEDWSWAEDYEDNRKRRKVISIGAALGAAPTYLNATRRNAIAVRYWQRA